MAVIQESKLKFSDAKHPELHHSKTDRHQGQRGGFLTLIHKSINFSRRPDSPDTLADPHLEELTITANMGNTDLIITDVYIPPASSCAGGCNPSLDHLMITTDTLILGDFSAHQSSWYSSSTDSRGTKAPRLRTRQSHLTALKYPPKADRQLFQPTVQHFKAGQTHFFPGEPIST